MVSRGAVGTPCAFTWDACAQVAVVVPVFATYPLKYAKHDFWNPDSPFAFGRDYPETTHMLFEDYRRRSFEEFLERSFA